MATGRRGGARRVIVADAGVALAWCIATRDTPAATRLIREGVPVVAPDLVIAEVANALATRARQDPGVQGLARDGFQMLPRWFRELVPVRDLRERALALAFELRHPAYDMFYLALAEARDLPLVTTDARLIARLEGTPHARRLRRLGP